MLEFPREWADLDVALCHDWLTGMRGGERVLEILCEGFPRAHLHTLIHVPGSVSDTIARHPIHTSWLQRLPGVGRHYRGLLPLFPGAIRTMPAARAQLLVSTSHCVAKALRSSASTRHLCYCFTPMRYAWVFADAYLGSNALKRLVAHPILAWLRRWDRRNSAEVDRFVAISRHVRERIERFYGRKADVVYPPVDTWRHRPGGDDAHDGFDLIVSALVPYKRIDLAVRAYSESGYPLRIVGVGGELAALRAMAAPNVSLLGWQPDETVLGLYQRCRQLVFPGQEDFGIVPLEAMACGRPVVAFARGGALETVRDGLSGVFFDAQEPEALREAAERCASMSWDRESLRRHAEAFAVPAFVEGMREVIDRCLRGEPEGTYEPAEVSAEA
jgi:glycosyltransferase involved in cell wall biosynthesis